MLLISFSLWLCAMKGTNWGIRIQLSQLSHRDMNRKEAVMLIYKCINSQCQNLELSEGSWWPSFTCNVPNATVSLISLWLALHTHFPSTYTTFLFLLMWLSRSYFSFTKGEQDEDHFSNKIQKKMFTHVPLHATLQNRASCWVKVLFTLRSGRNCTLSLTYIFKHTSLKCIIPKMTSNCWAEVIHSQKDTRCNSKVVKTGYAWTEIKRLLNAKDWPGFICV